MFDVETVKDFANRKFGWITPDGQLLVCSMHNHFEMLGEQYSVRYKELCSEYAARDSAQVYDEEQASGDEYYHPAWHRFDSEGDARNTVREELAEAGYLRLGMNTRGEGILEIDGEMPVYEKHKARVHFLFDMMPVDQLYLQPISYYRKRRLLASKR